ncbi:hypothetical protein ACHAXN_001126 [Cyclotella atomus]
MIEDCLSGKNDAEIGRCPFCRASTPESDDEYVEQLHHLVQKGNIYATKKLGQLYYEGKDGCQKDVAKAIEVLMKAGDLGIAGAYCSLGIIYYCEEEFKDKEKSRYYLELAAIGDNITSRTILGDFDEEEGNLHRAYKHYMIAAICGNKDSLAKIQGGFNMGVVTKDEYENTLRTYQRMKDELTNDKRDEYMTFRTNRFSKNLTD